MKSSQIPILDIIIVQIFMNLISDFIINHYLGSCNENYLSAFFEATRKHIYVLITVKPFIATAIIMMTNSGDDALTKGNTIRLMTSNISAKYNITLKKLLLVPIST